MAVKLDPSKLDTTNRAYLNILGHILGKHTGKTPEQIAFNDPDHFYSVIMPRSGKYFPNAWKSRVQIVDRASREFTSVLPCALCDDPAERMLIFRRGLPCAANSIYCTAHVPADVLSRGEAGDYRIGLYNVGKPKKIELIRLIAECMGLDPARSFTAKYLHERIDSIMATIPERSLFD
ncbi:hypothetical protein KY329_00660 [Candidatus Woesearchaeota archaeon]|nr:hypothetical protein [Candidatus Woesearchaeota archaeon]